MSVSDQNIKDMGSHILKGLAENLPGQTQKQLWEIYGDGRSELLWYVSAAIVELFQNNKIKYEHGLWKRTYVQI